MIIIPSISNYGFVFFGFHSTSHVIILLLATIIGLSIIHSMCNHRPSILIDPLTRFSDLPYSGPIVPMKPVYPKYMFSNAHNHHISFDR